MQSLDNLVAKILSDSEARAGEIINAARAQAEAAIAASGEQAAAEAEKIVYKADTEAERSYDRLVAELKLGLRDRVLTAKGEILDKVFAEALSRLNGMPRGDFLDYLKNALSRIDTDGESIILPEKYNIDSIDDINDFLKTKGKKGNLTLSGDKSRKISGGFILSKDGIEQNSTFEALIGFERYKLEAEIRKELF